VQIAILDLAKGDKEKIPVYVKAANVDYRDVLFWASPPPPPASKVNAHSQTVSNMIFRGTDVIYVKGASLSFIQNQLKEFGTLDLVYPDTNTAYEFIILDEIDDWILIGVPSNLSKFLFHDLTLWMTGIKPTHRPQKIIGCSTGNEEAADNYFVIPDENNSFGETIIGYRDDGVSIKVYVPDGTISENIRHSLKHQSVHNFLIEQGVPQQIMPGKKGVEIKSGLKYTVEIRIT
jgi:hypothetical protein